jgi:hypothetical protein
MTRKKRKQRYGKEAAAEETEAETRKKQKNY